MEQSTDGVQMVSADGTTDDEWTALGRALSAEDPEAYSEAREIVRELVRRVKQRGVNRASMLGFRLPRPTA